MLDKEKSSIWRCIFIGQVFIEIMGVPLPDFIKAKFEQLKDKGNPPPADTEDK
jgi:hypothetical protein